MSAASDKPIDFEAAFRDVAKDMAAAKAIIDAEWAAGIRSGPHAATWGMADGVLQMVTALQANDAEAFKVAAVETRRQAFSAQMHALAWVKNGTPR